MRKVLPFVSRAEREAAEKAEHARKMLGYDQPPRSRRTIEEFSARLRFSFNEINDVADRRETDPMYLMEGQEKPEA